MKNTKFGSKRLRYGTALLVVAALGVTACGDDDDSSSNTTGGSDNTTAPATGNLAEALGYSDNLLPDVSCNFGAVLALTGPGSFYGKTMSRGTDLAIKLIKEAGGPSFSVEYWDHKSGDPASGVTAMTEIIGKGITVKLASYIDNLGSMLPQTESGKVFTLDGGGGTSTFGQGKPFFWGTRAITPNDSLDGAFEYFKSVNPEGATVGFVGWDLGDASNKTIIDDYKARLATAGLTDSGLVELTPVGATDYAQSITKVKANQPDLLIVSLYGQDPGAFINQAATAGITSTMINFEFTPDGVNASKGVYEDGFIFAYDYFDASTAASPLAKLFVEKFNEEYGEDPDFYAANFFENVVRFWELMREASDAGATADQLCVGTTLNETLEADLELVSLYGGDDSTNGTSTLDPVTHSVSERPMGVFEYKNGSVSTLATFGMNGNGFTLAN
jgi:ABC-type branched-subunit amino acid transport system substrate-binding protein